MLIGNNIVNTLAAILVTLFLESHFRIKDEWVVTTILAPVLIILGETTPKGYGRHRSRAFLIEHALLMLFFFKLFYWPARTLIALSDIFLGWKGKHVRKNILVNEDEFRYLIEESVRSGVLEEHEKKLVERILDFERIPVDRVLTPVASIPQIELSQKIGEAKAAARRTGSKIILVYEEIPSIIIGMIYVFDLLFEADDEKPLRPYLRSPIFLPRETSLEKGFLTLQAKRQSFALVTDARLEVTGAVDIENLLAI
jgi:CBS domain containing-hemolysin-like protein